MPKEERVNSGVPGLNELLNGGFIESSCNLLTGSTGSGKSILAFQYLYSGAVDGEKCLYISLEQTAEHIIEVIRRMKFEKLDEILNKNFKVVNFAPFLKEYRGKVQTNILSEVGLWKASRVVIDSITMLSLFYENPAEFRFGLMELANGIMAKGATSLFVTEVQPMQLAYSSSGTEEFVADTIIHLFHKPIGNAFVRAIGIVKMRGSKHSENYHPMRITDKGIVVFSDQYLPKEYVLFK